jgi:uncharacterized protein YbjQ (UPF0145 family)
MSMGPATTTGMPQDTVGLPAAAQSRLQEAAQGGAALSLTSNSDFLLLEQMGFDPIGAVIGLSIVHIGQLQLAGIKQPVELEAYSRAISMGLLNALTRLQQEASMLGADGVLVTSADQSSFDAEEHQYAVKGTALRFRQQPGSLRTASGAPFVCSASVVTLYEMMRRGFVPISLGYGVCVFHVPHRSLRQALGQTFQNVEVPVFTEGWYTARAIALSRLQAQVTQQGAQVVLDVEVHEQAEAFAEHTSEFRAVGAGWARRDGIEAMMPEIDLATAALIDRGGAYASVAIDHRTPGAVRSGI